MLAVAAVALIWAVAAVVVESLPAPTALVAPQLISKSVRGVQELQLVRDKLQEVTGLTLHWEN